MSAIVLSETALGIGIATGPLVGSLLGGISWRGPFFGVMTLMSIALIATLVLVKRTPVPDRKLSLAAPIRALRHRGLLTMGLTALLYNWSFCTVLGFAPFPMHLDTHRLGIVFTGWGVLVATFAVFVAPRLQARFGIARALYLNLALFAVDVAVIAVFGTDQAVLIGAVVTTGIFIGINNTITTQAVMTVSPVETQRRVVRLRLRPVHRRRVGSLLRRPDGRAVGCPRAVLRRRPDRTGSMADSPAAHRLTTHRARPGRGMGPAGAHR